MKAAALKALDLNGKTILQILDSLRDHNPDYRMIDEACVFSGWLEHGYLTTDGDAVLISHISTGHERTRVIRDA